MGLMKELKIPIRTLRLKKSRLIGMVILIGAMFLSAEWAYSRGHRLEYLSNLFSSPTPTPLISLAQAKPLLSTTGIVEEINAERSRNGLSALSENPVLNLTAQDQLDDMFTRQYWDTKSPDGKQPWEKLKKNKYTYEYSALLTARGYTSSNGFVGALMGSQSKEILSRTYEDIGVAYRSGKLTGEDSTVAVVFLANKQKNTTSIATTQTNSVPTVDCTGPDGKHLRITQTDCESFNAAWNNNKKQVQSQTVSQVNIAFENAKNNVKYFQAKQCLSEAKRKSDSCSNDCNGPWNYGRNACAYALQNLDWDTSRYGECLNENTNIYSACLDSCTSTFTSEQDACIQAQKE